jgi:Profilin
MWRDYIYTIMKFKGAKKVGILYLADHTMLAKSEDFSIKPDQMEKILVGFNNPDLKITGFRVHDTKYVCKVTKENLICGQSFTSNFTCVKTNKVMFLGESEVDNKLKKRAGSAVEVSANEDLVDIKCSRVKSQEIINFPEKHNDDRFSQTPEFTIKLAELGDYLIKYDC